MILNQSRFEPYIQLFNSRDDERKIQYVSNDVAWEWLQENIPFFECPDREFEQTYYFRWWVYRKHVKKTPEGFIVTEFLPDVFWAGKHNSINSAVGHHMAEGRWLRGSGDFLGDYAKFWFRRGGSLRSYSCWLADAVWKYCNVVGSYELAIDLLSDMIVNYSSWEQTQLHASGLFWSNDDRDAMEYSVSGAGLRPTLNSYMYADATAIAKIAKLAGRTDVEREFSEKASKLKENIQKYLWDENAQFFKVIPLESVQKPIDVQKMNFNWLSMERNVREQIGFIPWYFQLPDEGYEEAWKHLLDAEGFHAPYGPTTVERQHPRFMYKHEEHECLWNGPSWPFATSQTLTGMAHLLQSYHQKVISKEHYFDVLSSYAKSHYRINDDGEKISWLDENLDPFTGEWLSRNILKQWNWREDKGGYERGRDYNHSTFCDLVISGLVGVVAREDNMLEINPLLPEGKWDYFCLEHLAYHGKEITVCYDKTGDRYGIGEGFHVFVNGNKVARHNSICKVHVKL